MATNGNQTTSLAEEVAKRVLEALKPEFDQLRGEIRTKTKALGEDIDAISARTTADKASIDHQLAGLRDDLSRHATTTKSVLDSHTARFRALDAKLDEIKDQNRTIVDRLARAHVPAG